MIARMMAAPVLIRYADPRRDTIFVRGAGRILDDGSKGGVR